MNDSKSPLPTPNFLRIGNIYNPLFKEDSYCIRNNSHRVNKAIIMKKHNHYYKNVKHYDSIDVYRVLHLFGVTNPCISHAIKKLLLAGGRGGGKDFAKDLDEAIDSLIRCRDMVQEDDPNSDITKV